MSIPNALTALMGRLRARRNQNAIHRVHTAAVAIDAWLSTQVQGKDAPSCLRATTDALGASQRTMNALRPLIELLPPGVHRAEIARGLVAGPTFAVIKSADALSLDAISPAACATLIPRLTAMSSADRDAFVAMAQSFCPCRAERYTETLLALVQMPTNSRTGAAEAMADDHDKRAKLEPSTLSIAMANHAFEDAAALVLTGTAVDLHDLRASWALKGQPEAFPLLAALLKMELVGVEELTQGAPVGEPWSCTP